MLNLIRWLKGCNRVKIMLKKKREKKVEPGAIYCKSFPS